MQLPSIQSSLAVRYGLAVLSPDGSERRIAQRRNLIMDSGLDLLASTLLCDCFKWAAYGDGTTPTKRDSGTVQIGFAGGVATSNAVYFEPDDVGRLIKLDSGEEAYVTGFTDNQTVSISNVDTVTASEGTIWYVDQTALASELRQTDTLSPDSGDHGSTFFNGVVTHKRTFVFGAVAAPETVREVGWKNASGGTLFGRDVLAAPVSLAVGQQLKITVEVDWAFAPNTPLAVADVGNNGFDTAGQLLFDTLDKDNGSYPNFSYIDSAGNTDLNFNNDWHDSFPGMLEPSRRVAVGLMTANPTLNSSTQLVEDGNGDLSCASYGVKVVAGQSYVNGSFKRTYLAKFSISEGNSAAINGIALGTAKYPNWSTGKIFRGVILKFDNPQTKDSEHTLDIAFSLQWGRNLQN